MKLSQKDFRDHMNKMVEKGQLKQARLWAESGTLIYSNVEELHELYDEEYRDQVEH